MTAAFARHLSDAIALNRERLPLYADLTAGASLPISRKLIRAEQLALPVARWLDRRATPYEERGIPVLSDVFIPLERTPPFRARVVPPAPPPLLLAPAGARQLAWGVSRAYRQGGWQGAASRLRTALGVLPGAPCYGCMVRHLLESALRSAVLAPRRAGQATSAGLHSTSALSWRLVWLHLVVLTQAAGLDRQAAALQARGVPIVCQDVPPVPIP